jgi:hypothetical protein
LYLNREKVAAAFSALTAASPDRISLKNWQTNLLPWCIAAVMMATLFFIELKGIRQLGALLAPQ